MLVSSVMPIASQCTQAVKRRVTHLKCVQFLLVSHIQ